MLSREGRHMKSAIHSAREYRGLSPVSAQAGISTMKHLWQFEQLRSGRHPAPGPSQCNGLWIPSFPLNRDSAQRRISRAEIIRQRTPWALSTHFTPKATTSASWRQQVQGQSFIDIHPHVEASVPTMSRCLSTGSSNGDRAWMMRLCRTRLPKSELRRKSCAICWKQTRHRDPMAGNPHLLVPGSLRNFLCGPFSLREHNLAAISITGRFGPATSSETEA